MREWIARQPTGLRQRLTLITAVVVAIPLLLGVLIVANLLQRSLTSSLDSTLRSELSAVSARVATGGPQAAAGSLAEGSRAIVLTTDRRVVYADQGAEVATVPAASPGRVEVAGERWWWLPGDNNTPAVATTTVSHTGTAYLVQIGASQQNTHEAVTRTAKILLAAIPFLVLLSAGIAWLAVARTLRPVEAMRAQVERIGAAQLTDRVPVPPTKDEIATLAHTMNGMLGRLERAQGQQRQFVADASHELRSPIATLRATLEVAAGDETGSRWREFEPLMTAEVLRVQRLVDDLLLLSKTDDEALALHRGDVDLDDLLTAEARRVRATTALQVELTAPPTRVTGDVAQLTRVIRNVVDNAVRHAESRIALSVQAIGNRAVISVADDGPGLTGVDRSVVFDRFVRLDDGRSRDAGGSGLGLPIAAGIVAAHGGTIEFVDPAMQSGAQVEIRLPAGG